MALKKVNPEPIARVESQLLFRDRARKVVYINAKLKSLERELSNRN